MKKFLSLKLIIMKKIFLYIITLTLFACQDGPKAAFNEEFVQVNPKKELPLTKLIGEYQLDNDSKKRYGIKDSCTFLLKINDSEIYCNRYINIKTRKIERKEKKYLMYYVNNFKDQYPSNFIGVRDATKENFYSDIAVYWRKKDSLLALYIYTPPLKGQEHGDYLRYIKVK